MKQHHTPSNSSNASPVLMSMLLFGSVVYILTYVWIVYHRLSFPFDLEWIEGGMVDQVQRITRGEGVYLPPSIDFVPFLYPPLYFYLSAAMSWLVGDGLTPLRLVSFISSLASFATIFAIVHSETKSWRMALMAAGLFAASFRVTGAWLDIARVDSLFIALWLAFVLIVVRGVTSSRSALLAGTLAALAFLAKQSAFIAIAPVLLYLFLRNWKHAVTTLAAAAAIISGVTVYFQYMSGGWFTFYVFELLSQQTEWLPPMFLRFWTEDLFGRVPVATLCAIFFLASKQRHNRDAFYRWLSICAGAVAAAFFTRVKFGGYDNVLLPMIAVASMLFSIGAHEALNRLELIAAEYRKRTAALILTACIIQLAMLLYDPVKQVPTAADREAGQALLRQMAAIPGKVYLLDHGYMPTLAGKKTYAHHSTIWDVMRGDRETRGKTILRKSLDDAVRRQEFDVIILDSEWNYLSSALYTSYTRRGEVTYPSDGFFMITGWQRRPTHMYVPQRMQ